MDKTKKAGLLRQSVEELRVAHRGTRLYRTVCAKQELHREGTPEIYRGTPQIFNWALIRSCVWGNYSRPGKDSYEIMRDNNASQS